MAQYRTQRNRVNPSNPEAGAICDRCGFLYSHADLAWQHQYGGTGLINLNILVCPRCLDEPQPQLQAKIIPTDPEVVLNARPPAWYSQEQMAILMGRPVVLPQARPAPAPADPRAIPGDD